jgi:hypothetical protein
VIHRRPPARHAAAVRTTQAHQHSALIGKFVAAAGKQHAAGKMALKGVRTSSSSSSDKKPASSKK